MKKFIGLLVFVSIFFFISLVGGSIYMLDYSLAADPNRVDVDSFYIKLFQDYPETKEWMDSIHEVDALRDTTLTMSGGYKCHAYYIDKSSKKTAIIIHGWRDQAIKFFYLAKMYEHSFDYNVLIPDVYAHGLSDGDYIRMGWLDRLDMLRWIEVFKTDTMVVHGVSMGAATTMMLSGEQMPGEIKDLRFIEDCGYTSVWDEFSGQMKEQFGLPEFPLLYTSSLLCKMLYGWSFGEASAITQIGKAHHPMLLIHGDSDTFVPTVMVYRLYDAKPEPKELWITKHTDHALSYKNHRKEYIERVRTFLNTSYHEKIK